MTTADERARMLAVPLCGARVVMRLESIGVTRLAELRGRRAADVVHEVNLQAGRRIWHPPLALQAIENLIDAAEREDDTSSGSAAAPR